VRFYRKNQRFFDSGPRAPERSARARDPRGADAAARSRAARHAKNTGKHGFFSQRGLSAARERAIIRAVRERLVRPRAAREKNFLARRTTRRAAMSRVRGNALDTRARATCATAIAVRCAPRRGSEARALRHRCVSALTRLTHAARSHAETNLFGARGRADGWRRSP
jgi:hypothetical protein